MRQALRYTGFHARPCTMKLIVTIYSSVSSESRLLIIIVLFLLSFCHYQNKSSSFYSSQLLSWAARWIYQRSDEYRNKNDKYRPASFVTWNKQLQQNNKRWELSLVIAIGNGWRNRKRDSVQHYVASRIRYNLIEIEQ